MRIWSDDFKQGDTIEPLYTCDNKDVSPHLAWDGVPRGAKSMALIMDDPDAPRGTWTHWLVCDIAPDVTGAVRGTVPGGGKEVPNDFSKPEYGGPCPPSGVHRYFFKLYALDVDRLPADDKVGFYAEVKKHTIAEAVIMGTYTRQK